MDTIALVDNYPSEDERVLAEEIIRGGGGPAAVAAVALIGLTDAPGQGASTAPGPPAVGALPAVSVVFNVPNS